MTSRIPGFFKLDVPDRVVRIREIAGLTDEETQLLAASFGALEQDRADRMVENVVGVMGVPLGIAVNFLVNGRDYLIPMAIEEPSVIAAASNAARIMRDASHGGISAHYVSAMMIGQVQLVKLPDPVAAREAVLAARDAVLAEANAADPILVRLGGGARDLEARLLPETPAGPMLIVHLIVDTKDAMGANAVNTMAETVTPTLERLTGGQVRLRILSNLADRRVVQASVAIAEAHLGTDEFAGADVAERIVEAYAFAAADPYRAATHNKGIMNGMDAVALATGNDWRALEAGAHAYAARDGRYRPLSAWTRDGKGHLVGTLEMPVVLGLVGGATRTHPTAQLAVKVLGVQTAAEFGEVVAAVGLAQNFAALKALSTEGIQRGHMALHARNVAMSAGAEGEQVDRVAAQMVAERAINIARAKEILETLTA
ncbi:MAG: hydroxymethylglutaryl-CoA reductase, degradative [Chloroflexi bacterium]|nr:hydroxymethylglutaryl-CoA reductase, degradative [Chloroflexota bacterium]MBU1750294.1 hydroxymethylglutaryl-CoA reductase, degradative [Chloroflexota bacterium]